MCQFWIQNHFCPILGGGEIWNTKYGSEVDKFIIIFIYSVSYGLRVAPSYPKRPQLGPDWSWEPLIDHWRPKLLELVNKFHIFFILIALQNMQWLKILRKFGFITSTFRKSPILFCTYLSYLKSYRNVSVFKICVWILVFRRKKQFVDPLHSLQVTRYKIIQAFFLKHPVQFSIKSIWFFSKRF